MDIHELLAAVSLKDVRTIQESAQLKLDASAGKGLSAIEATSPDGELSLDINPVAWERRIETWFRARFEGPEVQLVAAVATLYDRESDEPVPSATQQEFIEKVAVMAAYPYLRSALQEMAARLRLGNFTLDILRQGEFAMAAPLDEAAAPAEDHDTN